MPPGFQFPAGMAIWVPIPIGTRATLMREAHSYLGVARMTPNASAPLAAQELSSIAAELERTYPTSNAGYRFDVQSLTDRVTGSVRETLFLLTGITAFLLLIGSANVANLLLARATTRRREVPVRHALGPPRTRIIDAMRYSG